MHPCVPWIVPCPNSEIAACYHPSDLLRTVAQAVGTVFERSTKNVSLKKITTHTNDLGGS